MPSETVHLAGFGELPANRLADLRHAIEKAGCPVIAGVLFSTGEPDISAYVLRTLRELAPVSPPREPEPVEEHVGPVVTSFEQVLYLLSRGWRPGESS